MRLVDDLDGTEAGTTRWVGVDGQWFELDLSPHNSDQLDKLLQPLVEAGRRVAKVGKPGAQPVPAAQRGKRSREERQAAREWAAKHGCPVAAKGRLENCVWLGYKRNDPKLLTASRYYKGEAA